MIVDNLIICLVLRTYELRSEYDKDRTILEVEEKPRSEKHHSRYFDDADRKDRTLTKYIWEINKDSLVSNVNVISRNECYDL